MSVPAPGAPAAMGGSAVKAQPLKNKGGLATNFRAGNKAEGGASSNQLDQAPGAQTSAASSAAETAKEAKNTKVSTQLTQPEILQQALDRLAKGLFFHTVPPTLTAGQTVTIEAGVAQKFTEALRKELQGPITLLPNVQYDPSNYKFGN